MQSGIKSGFSNELELNDFDAKIKTKLNNELFILKILFVMINLFLLAMILAECCHQFLLVTTKPIPVGNLPTIRGNITKIYHCTPSKKGRINRVKVSSLGNGELDVYTPCLGGYPEEFFIGKPILSIREKFNFPTFKEEGRIFLKIDNIIFQDLPKYRSEPTKEKTIDTLLNEIKTPLILHGAISSFFIFIYVKIKFRIENGWRLIKKHMEGARVAFVTRVKNPEIISLTEKFNSTPRYSDAFYSLEIYYKTINGGFWVFKSNGDMQKITPIPTQIAIIKGLK